MSLKKLHYYLFTFCRYFLGTMILAYAFAKILGTQFTTQPSVYDQPLGKVSGMNLTWYYYGYSAWYGLLIAILQITSAFLLFFKKTTRIGIILFLSFMVNITLMDYAFNINGAKGMATLLTLMGFYVFLSDYKLLKRYFVDEKPLFTEYEKPNWLKKISILKWIYIPVAVLGIFFMLFTLKKKYMSQNKFYGTWHNVDENSMYKNFNFEALETFRINGDYNIKIIDEGTYKFTNEEITLLSEPDDHKKVQDPDKINVIFRGKYELKSNELILQNDSVKYILKRVR